MASTDTRIRRWGLLAERDFRHLWAADALSQLGSRASMLAVPLLAISMLDASAFEVSLLRFASTVAYLLVGLQVGAWCDRLRCLPLLVWADAGRFLLLASIPLGALSGVLTLTQVYVVLLACGVLSVVFDVARQAYLPRLVGRDQLLEGNSRLQANLSVAAVAAPSVAGYLVQFFTAAAAILLDSLTYLWSALWLGTIRGREPAPPRPERRNLRREIAEGLRLVRRQPILRAIGGHSASISLFQSIQLALGVVFAARDLHLSAGTIGALSSVGLLGALLAASVTRRLADRFGAARMLLLVSVGFGVGMFGYPLSTEGWGVICYALAGFLCSFCIVVINIVVLTFQQALCPDRLRGRLSATMGFLFGSMLPVGSLLGGLLAVVAGNRAALWVAAAGVLVSATWLLCSPLRGMRVLPGEQLDEEQGGVSAGSRR